MTIRLDMPRSVFSLFLYTRYGLKGSVFLSTSVCCFSPCVPFCIYAENANQTIPFRENVG